jgi:diguanylate cyclase (GGDEF)-like protein
MSKEAGRNCGHWHDGEQCLPVVGTPAPPPTPAPVATSGGSKLIDCLATRATFADILHRRVTESHRFGIPLSVMHVRVDDFAKIKQEYGKSVAHLALDSVAQFTQASLREMDLLARLEEGEFIALLPGSTLLEATQIGKRLQTAAANSTVPAQNEKPQLRVSHGIAELRPNETAALLMARAKAAVATAAEHTKPLATA